MWLQHRKIICRKHFFLAKVIQEVNQALNIDVLCLREQVKMSLLCHLIQSTEPGLV